MHRQDSPAFASEPGLSHHPKFVMAKFFSHPQIYPPPSMTYVSGLSLNFATLEVPDAECAVALKMSQAI